MKEGVVVERTGKIKRIVLSGKKESGRTRALHWGVIGLLFIVRALHWGKGKGKWKKELGPAGPSLNMNCF